MYSVAHCLPTKSKEAEGVMQKVGQIEICSVSFQFWSVQCCLVSSVHPAITNTIKSKEVLKYLLYNMLYTLR